MATTTKETPPAQPEVQEQQPETDNPFEGTEKPKAPKLTVGRQVHYYFEVPGKPHAATVADVGDNGEICLAVLCHHLHEVRFRDNVPYSESPKARHYTMPPRV